jgi:hypothetical protein
MRDSDGWTGLVWDLIEVGLRKAFNRKRSGIKNGGRFVGERPEELDGECYTMKTPASTQVAAKSILGEHNSSLLFSTGDDQEPPFSQVPDDNLSNEGGQGISIVLLETESREG